MKLTNVPAELRNGVKKQGQNGQPNETFIMLGLTTVRLAFNDDLDILSISVNNGEKINNPTSIKIEDGKLKVEIEKKDDLVTEKEPPVALDSPIKPSISTFIDGADGRPFTRPTPVVEAPKAGPLKMSDLPLELRGGIMKQGMNGEPSESFILLENHMTVKLAFNDNSEILSISVNNGEKINNPTSIKLENGKLKVETNGIVAPTPAYSLSATPTPVVETPKTGSLKIGDIASNLKQGIKKVGTDGAPDEIFSIIGTNLLRICYNPFTEEVTSVEVNGEQFDNPTSLTLVDGKLSVTVKTADDELNNQPGL